MTIGPHLYTVLADMKAETRTAAPVLVRHGRFNRSDIMREAVRLARHVFSSLGSWRVRMARALRTIWARAKEEMRLDVRAKALLAARAGATSSFSRTIPLASRVIPASRNRAFVSGSRSFSHGW